MRTVKFVHGTSEVFAFGESKGRFSLFAKIQFIITHTKRSKAVAFPGGGRLSDTPKLVLVGGTYTCVVGIQGSDTPIIC